MANTTKELTNCDLQDHFHYSVFLYLSLASSFALHFSCISQFPYQPKLLVIISHTIIHFPEAMGKEHLQAPKSRPGIWQCLISKLVSIFSCQNNSDISLMTENILKIKA